MYVYCYVCLHVLGCQDKKKTENRYRYREKKAVERFKQGRESVSKSGLELEELNNIFIKIIRLIIFFIIML